MLNACAIVLPSSIFLRPFSMLQRYIEEECTATTAE